MMSTGSKGNEKPITVSGADDLHKEERHPSLSEKGWAERTLARALETAPERPIGAPTGVNVDEDGNARFTTISGTPVRRLYTQADLPVDWNYEAQLNYPGQPP